MRLPSRRTDRHASHGRRPPGEPRPRRRRREAEAFLETVEFTAVDFLADDPERDAEIRARFGPQVAELVRRDRQQNVRRAFRSFPLHELPASSRTINPFALYETYLAGGRIVLLPFYLIGAVARGRGPGRPERLPRRRARSSTPGSTRTAASRRTPTGPPCGRSTGCASRSSWDRSGCGPGSTSSTWACPAHGPAGDRRRVADGGRPRLTSARRGRTGSSPSRSAASTRGGSSGSAAGCSGSAGPSTSCPHYLCREIPYLANRGGEALRALVAACVLDHDDIATLALSIEGLERCHGLRRRPVAATPDVLPPGLPEPVVNLRTLWHPVHRIRRPAADLFDLPCFPAYDPAQRRRIAGYLRRHRRAVRGWIRVVLGQGGADPWATVRTRMRDVLLRTDLWSDQILVLRAVQTLTMLDVQHNCELVWNLGGYTVTTPAPSDESEPPESDGSPGESGPSHHPPRRSMIASAKMGNPGNVHILLDSSAAAAAGGECVGGFEIPVVGRGRNRPRAARRRGQTRGRFSSRPRELWRLTR